MGKHGGDWAGGFSAWPGIAHPVLKRVASRMVLSIPRNAGETGFWHWRQCDGVLGAYSKNN